MDVRFGATIVQAIPFPAVLDDFRFAGSIGLDNVWVIDQSCIDEAPDVTLLEAWTTLAAIAGETERIGIGTAQGSRTQFEQLAAEDFSRF